MTPILMSAPDRDAAPHAYIIHKHSQLCRCGALHEWSAVYAKTHFKARMGHKYVTNLRPVRDPNEVSYNLPIEQIQMPIEKLLFCHECFSSASLSHLPAPPPPTTEQAASKLADMGVVQRQTPRTRHWGADGSERYEEADAPTAAKAARPKAKPFTIDDL